MAKFQLTNGGHRIGRVVNRDTEGNITSIENGYNLGVGDVVESKLDLGMKWPEKFRRVADDTPVTKPVADEPLTATPIEKSETAKVEDEEELAVLLGMSKNDLLAQAKDLGITVDKNGSKESIAQTIMQASRG